MSDYLYLPFHTTANPLNQYESIEITDDGHSTLGAKYTTKYQSESTTYGYCTRRDVARYIWQTPIKRKEVEKYNEEQRLIDGDHILLLDEYF